MKTRTSVVYLALLPIGITVIAMTRLGVPLAHWLDVWPLLPFIAAATGSLYIVFRDDKDTAAPSKAV